MALSLSGLASGVDWNSLVDQLTALERAPQTALRREQATLASRTTAYSTLVAELLALQTKANALKATGLFQQRSASVDNFSAATASAAEGTAAGSYTFAFSQLATAAKQVGGANIGAALSATSDVSGVVLSNAPLATAVTAGSFTVNGAQVTIETSDTLQQVFTKISAATGGAVTASYSSSTDKITLTSGTAITLGSAGDTSNFLQVARLAQNSTGTVTSALALGVVRSSAALNAANFAAAISGTGEFKVNGVSIAYDASADTLADVLARITNSAAGVTAQYDPLTDQVTLTNKSTGNVGIALQDVSGNFLAATKLLASAGGALAAGKDLEYTVNGGPTLTSRSNTATAESHGITGLSVTALAGATSVTTAAAGATGFPMLVAQFGGSGTQTRVRTTPPHNYQTGYAVKFVTDGALPSQINADTIYYVRRIDANNFSLHLTPAAAANNTGAINFGTSPVWSGDTYSIQVDPTATGSTTTTPSTVTVTVGNDTAAIRTAIEDLVAQYNKVQALIDVNTASSTDAKGVVTAGILAGDRDITSLASELRRTIYGEMTGLSGAISRFAQLGYATNGNNDQLALADSATLDAALASDLAGVQAFFADATAGLATTLSNYLERQAGDNGALLTRQATFATQTARIDEQIAALERTVESNRQRLIASFLAMERAQAQINQQLQFLQSRFGAGASS